MNDSANSKMLDEALYWVRVTERQMGTFVDSLISVAETHAKDSMPALADGHFLLISSAQAERTLKAAGYPMDPKLAFTLRKLRDVHEHWEQHKNSFRSDKLAKRLSGKDFAEAFPGALPWRYTIDDTGTWISALRLEDLWKELLLKESIIGNLINNLQVTFSNDVARPFPKRETKLLGFVMVTQDFAVNFDKRQ